MKIICVGKHLKDAVVIAERNTSKNKTLPILNSILLQAKNNELTIRATNLETAVEIKIPCKVENSGIVVVSGKILSSFLYQISEDTVQIQSQKDNLFIKTKKTQTTIRGYSSNDFPLFPNIEDIFSFSLPSQELKNGLENVSFATSNSDIKPEFASVCFKILKNTLKLVATDSFRLAEQTILFQKLNIEKSITLLIPHTSVLELLRLLDIQKDALSLGDEKEISLISNKNQIIFQNSRVRFISRLTEGVFPDYDQIIPKSFKTEVVIKQNELLHQIKLASIFVGRLQDISIIVQPQNKKMLFQVSNSDVGEHLSEIEISSHGEETSAKFNWKYIFDGINHISSEYVVLGFNGDQSPLIIKGKGDTSYYYLAMPMRGI